MNKHKAGPSTAQKEAYLQRLLDALSPANADDVRRFITRKRPEGLRTASIQNLAIALTTFDPFTNRTALRSITAVQFVHFFAVHLGRRSPTTLWSHGVEFDAKGGARLRFPPPLESLKTGTRTVSTSSSGPVPSGRGGTSIPEAADPARRYVPLFPCGSGLTPFVGVKTLS